MADNSSDYVRATTEKIDTFLLGLHPVALEEMMHDGAQA